MSSYKMAMMGEEITAAVFEALGIETSVTGIGEDDIREAKRTMRRWIRSGEYGAIFITEELSETMDDILEEATYLYLPSIILIPDVKGSRGLAESIVRENRKKAAGRDIMAEE